MGGTATDAEGGKCDARASPMRHHPPCPLGPYPATVCRRGCRAAVAHSHARAVSSPSCEGKLPLRSLPLRHTQYMHMRCIVTCHVLYTHSTYRVDLTLHNQLPGQTQSSEGVRRAKEPFRLQFSVRSSGGNTSACSYCCSLLYKNQPAPRPPKAPIKGVFHTLRESHARGCNPAGIMLTSPLPVGVVNTRSRMGARRQWRRRAKRDGGDDGLACGLVIVAQRDAP